MRACAAAGQRRRYFPPPGKSVGKSFLRAAPLPLPIGKGSSGRREIPGQCSLCRIEGDALSTGTRLAP